MLSLRKAILENWPLKLLALLLAFLMWLAVASEQFERRLFPDVRVEYRNKPEQLEIVGPPGSSFEVELLTPVRRNIVESDLSIVIDLADAQEGNRVFPLGPGSVRVPEGVEVVRVNPSRLVLTLERATSKVVPVVPRLEGTLPSGYEVRAVTSNPPTVSVSGSASKVARVSGVTTEAINLTARTRSFSQTLNVVGEEATVRIDRLQPVEVFVEIAEQRRTLMVHDIAVQVEGNGGQCAVRPSRVAAAVSVPVSFLGPLKPDQFRAYVDVSGLAPQTGDREIGPTVVLREPMAVDVQLLNTDPGKVRLRCPSR